MNVDADVDWHADPAEAATPIVHDLQVEPVPHTDVVGQHSVEGPAGTSAPAGDAQATAVIAPDGHAGVGDTRASSS